MPYITLPVPPKTYQLSFEDILNGVDSNLINTVNTYDTRTTYRTRTPDRLKELIDVNEMINILKKFNDAHRNLIDTVDKSLLYKHFTIPKRSGGLRPIDAPKDELMHALRDLKYIFEKHLFATYHTCAFAYAKGRCPVLAVKRHQENHSRWFLKLDFSNFFGSTTEEFLFNQIKTIFPYSEIVLYTDGEKALKESLSLCFLNGGLPQGTPMSPTLTNIMMIPIDHYISKTFREHTPHLVYTRYADDIILSSDISFNYKEVENSIIEILAKFDAPFKLNTSKTRYGSSAGRNWNLGVMLNKDNEITIGYQKKKRFKAMLFSLHNDFQKEVFWNLEDVQALQGIIAYYKSIEKERIEEIIASYDEKFGIKTEQIIKNLLKT